MSTLELLNIAREVYATLFVGRKWFEDFVYHQLAAAFKAGEEQFRTDILKYGVGSNAMFDQFLLELVLKIYSGSIAKLTQATTNDPAATRAAFVSDEDASTDQSTLVSDSNDTKSDPEASVDGSDDGVKDSKPADTVPELPEEKPKSPSPAPASPLSFIFRSPQPVRYQSFAPESTPSKTEPKSELEPTLKENLKPATSSKPVPEKAAPVHPEKAPQPEKTTQPDEEIQPEKASFDKPDPNPKFTLRSGAQTPEDAPGDDSSPRKKSKKKRGGKKKSGNSSTPSSGNPNAPLSGNSNTPSNPVAGTPDKLGLKWKAESISFFSNHER